MNITALIFDELLVGFSNIVGVQHVGPLPTRRDAVRAPAIFLSLVELEPSTNPGTEELALIAHWEAHVVMSDQTDEPRLWALVQRAMLWLFTYDWPLIHAGHAQLKQAAPDHFSPDFQGHRVWLIEWTQACRVGDNVWTGEGIVPSLISIGGLATERQDTSI